ncbi:MAG: thioredoxin 1 [Candidatus Paceibacteria bacterium]|jgi:thioredoxin 1
MNTQSKIFIGLGIVLLLVVGFNLERNDSDDRSNLAANDSSIVKTAELADEETELANEEVVGDTKIEDEKVMTDSEVMNGNETVSADTLSAAPAAPLAAGIYTTYTPAAITNSVGEFIVLNFSATWCPSCRTVDKNINADLSSIPAGVEIYKVDYDTNVALRKQYGVTTQHTFVLVSSDGAMVKKWVGGSTLKDVLAKL